jgi:5-methylcytosine-specific restriction endonuclease McrA
MKQCTGCHKTLDASCFSSDRRASDGLQSRCKNCINRSRREKYQADPELFREKRRAYYANNTQIVAEVNRKSREKNRDYLLAAKKEYYERIKLDPNWQEIQRKKRLENKESKRAYDAKYAEANSAKKVLMAREWQKANPLRRSTITHSYDARRRAITAEGDATTVIHKWITQQKKECYWCGVKCKQKFHIDHYQPLSKEGRHEISNLVVSCPSCNLKKNAKDPFVFAQKEFGRLF